MKKIITMLEAEIRASPDSFDAKVDETYDFPTQVMIDYDKNYYDDELTLRVSNFEVPP